MRKFYMMGGDESLSVFFRHIGVRSTRIVLMVTLMVCPTYFVTAGASASALYHNPIQSELHGLVVDTNKVPLANATVMIKGTTVGTQTDDNGRFSFPSLASDAVITVTYTGYLTQEIEVNNRQHITVVLQQDPASLDEVVVVAFGTQKKTDLVGAVTTVKPDDLRVPASNLTTAL